jgi:hypothetical protein
LKRNKIEGIEPEFARAQRFLMDMGTAIEPVVLDYLSGNVTAVGERDVKVMMEADPYFRCTLDGRTVIGQPIQCKFHTGDKTIDDLVEYYWPQLQHELLVTSEKVLVFAVAFGHYGRFDHHLVECDYDFQSNYMLRALQFKEYCWGNAPLPADLAEGEAAPLKQNVPRLRDHVWPTNDNEIATLATQWLEAKPFVEQFKEVDTNLKKMVPEDCRSASWLRNGAGIKITVNKAGSKSIKAHVSAR